MTPTSFRILVASSVGVVIWIIWLTGLVGDSRQITMLALSEVAVLGTGLVVALRSGYRAEAAARQAERRYRFLSDYSFDMIVRFDPRTQRRTYISPAARRLYGYEPEEAMAMSAEEIIHPDDMPVVTAALQRSREGAEQPLVRYRGRRKDGSYVWVEASLSRLEDPATGAHEIVSIVRDISERIAQETALRQAKEAADAANRSKSRFLATMSHELRTPLNAVIGFTEIMQHQEPGAISPEKYHSYVTDIHDSGTHLLQLINEILDLSRVEAGKLELREESFDLREIIETVVRLSATEIERAGLTVELDVTPGLPPLRADTRQTRQVLFNLIGNAIKFTPSGGRIIVAARADLRAGLRIAVKDTGIGIAPEDLPRVMEPFVQVDSSLSRQHAGSGLGLPTTKAIMASHGGVLELTSTVGVGTEAAVVFPSERILEPGREPPVVQSAA